MSSTTGRTATRRRRGHRVDGRRRASDGACPAGSRVAQPGHTRGSEAAGRGWACDHSDRPSGSETSRPRCRRGRCRSAGRRRRHEAHGRLGVGEAMPLHGLRSVVQLAEHVTRNAQARGVLAKGEGVGRGNPGHLRRSGPHADQRHPAYRRLHRRVNNLAGTRIRNCGNVVQASPRAVRPGRVPPPTGRAALLPGAGVEGQPAPRVR